MHSLQNYGADEPFYDGNAYSFTATYHNGTGTMQLYATHPTAHRGEDEPAEYHMTQIKAFAMTSDGDTYRKGATYYRNARDMASTMRDSFIEKANDLALEMPAETPPSSQLSQPSCRTSGTTAPEADSDTSVDELALSPAPSKRSRRGQAPTVPRTPLLPSEMLTPSQHLSRRWNGRCRHSKWCSPPSATAKTTCQGEASSGHHIQDETQREAWPGIPARWRSGVCG